MTGGNEQQGAMCGTCGHPRGSMYHAERFTGRHDFIPAPVSQGGQGKSGG